MKPAVTAAVAVFAAIAILWLALVAADVRFPAHKPATFVSGVRKEDLAGYQAQVQRGRTTMKAGPRFLLLALIQNAEKSLPALEASVEAYHEAAGGQLVAVFMENDSKDGTRAALESFAQKHPWARLMTCCEDAGDASQVEAACACALRGALLKASKPEGAWPRFWKMARLREAMREVGREEHAAQAFDYVMVFDGDFAGLPPLDAFQAAIAQAQDWDVLFGLSYTTSRLALGLTKTYYDTLAHINPGMATPACLTTRGHGLCLDRKAARRQVAPWFDRDALVPVDTAFGGIGIYKAPVFFEEAASYGDGGYCEHIVFHLQLRDLGHTRMFVYPPLKLWV